MYTHISFHSSVIISFYISTPRTVLNLSTQEEIPMIKSETRTNMLAAAVHQV